MNGRYELFVNEPQRFIKCFPRVVVCLLAATVLRLALDPFLGQYEPLVTFLLAGIIIAWLCGLWSAIFTLIAGLLISLAVFVPVDQHDQVSSPGFITDIIQFFVVGTVAAIISELLHRSRYRLTAKAERAARSAEERLQTITDVIPVLISYVGKDGCYELVNQEYERWFKHSRAEIEGKHMADVVGESAWTAIKPYADQALSGKEVNFEGHLDYRDAGPRWVSISYFPDRDEHGVVQGFVGLVSDLTSRRQAEDTIQAWRDRYEKVVSASGMIVYDVDAAAEKVFLGGSLTEITGYEVFQLGGRVQNWIDLVHPDDRSKFTEQIKESRVSGTFDLEYRFKRADGAYINLHDRGFALFDASGNVSRVLGLVSDVTKLRLAEQERQSLAERLEEAREDERRRLSRLLHDDVGQQLAAISIKLHRLERKLTDAAPEEQSVIAGLVVVEELLHQTQSSIRNIAHILHPSVLEHFGLAEAVRRFVEGVSQASNSENLPAITINVEQGFPRLGLEVETMIYRVIQEAVTNALKHAHARSVTVDLVRTPERVVAVVSDDGRGFGPEAARTTGIGLAGMQDRANAFGSTIAITSAPGEGTTVTLYVPYRSSEPEIIGDEGKAGVGVN